MPKKKKRGFYDPQSERTASTAFAVIEKLRGCTEEDVLTNIFVTSNDPFIKKLIVDMEYILLDAVTNPQRFIENLHFALDKKAKEVIAANKVKEFYEYVHLMLKRLDKKVVSIKIADAYYDLMIQLTSYFVPVGKLAIGISSSGELVYMDEIYPNIDKVVYECNLKSVHRGYSPEQYSSMVVSEFRKLGHPVSSMRDIEKMFLSERIIDNMLFLCVLFVEDKKSPLLKKPFFNAEWKLDTKFPNKHFMTKELQSHLGNRKRLLPKSGITVSFNDDSDFTELYLKEKFIGDSLHVAYRTTVSGKNLIGYFDTSSDMFYSIFNESQSLSEKQKMAFSDAHRRLQNYILEAYCILTTDIETSVQLYSIENEDDTKKSKSKTKTHTSHRIDRSKLFKTQTEVDAYIRRLPMDAVASDEAISLAKKYGITLGVGETFVKPFVKKVHRKV